MKPKLFFDMDGTLVGSAEDILTAINAMRREFDLTVPLTSEYLKSIIGEGMPATVKTVLHQDFSQCEVQNIYALAVQKTREHFFEHCGTQSILFDGVKETLDTLSKTHAMAVVTNQYEVLAKRTLTKLDIAQYFQVIIGGDSTNWFKPHPAALASAMKTLNATANHALYIGDSIVDVQIAKQMLMPMVLISHGYAQPSKSSRFQPNWCISHITQLKNLLEGI